MDINSRESRMISRSNTYNYGQAQYQSEFSIENFPKQPQRYRSTVRRNRTINAHVPQHHHRHQQLQPQQPHQEQQQQYHHHQRHQSVNVSDISEMSTSLRRVRCDSPYDFVNNMNLKNDNSMDSIARRKEQHLTPYQVQRRKMKSSFTFPNGEAFTPRNQFKKTMNYEDRPMPVLLPQIKITTSSTIDKKKPKRFGSFFKKILAKEKESNIDNSMDDITEFQNLSLLSIPLQQSGDEFYSRLQKRWNKVHLNTSPSDTTINSQLNSISFSSLSVSNNSDSINAFSFDESSMIKSVNFSNEIFVNETFSTTDYKRANAEVGQNNESNEMLGNFHNNEIKLELNKFKQQEMRIHHDSLQFTHFFR